MIRIFILGFMSVLLTSCDCVQNVSGVIVDRETGFPISGVTVYKKEKPLDEDVTCEKGYFKIESISGGFGCPDMNIVIKKEGYQTIEYSIGAGEHEEIRLTLIKQ